MIPWIVDAEYLDEYRVYVVFNDGARGVLDLEGEFDGEIFEPLKDKAFFRAFTIQGHTLAWENGADFAPEYLRSLLSEVTSATS